MIKRRVSAAEMHVASLQFPFELLPLDLYFFPLPQPYKDYSSTTVARMSWVLPSCLALMWPQALFCTVWDCSCSLVPISEGIWQFLLSFGSKHSRQVISTPCLANQIHHPTINPAFSMAWVQPSPSRAYPLLNLAFSRRLT